LSKEVDFRRAVKYTLKPNTKVFAELHSKPQFEQYFRQTMDRFFRNRAERMQAQCIRKLWRNLYAADYLHWCRLIGRVQDFPEGLRQTLLSD